MTLQKPAKSVGTNIQTVDDEDPDSSPVADKPHEKGSVADQLAKDNEGIQKGAP